MFGPAQSSPDAGAVVQDAVADARSRPAIAGQTLPTDEQEPAALLPLQAPAPAPVSVSKIPGPNAGAARKLATDATRPNKTAPSLNTHANARKPARTAGKPKRPITMAADTSTLADSDVALISAVIQHATNRPDQECAAPECAAKATPEP
jgi:hypothetical protein